MFIRPHFARDKFSGDCNSDQPIDRAIESATQLGIPFLRDEASAHPPIPRSRVGNASFPPRVDEVEHVCLGCPALTGKITVADMALRGSNWKVADLGDTNPEFDSDPAWGLYGERLTEKNVSLAHSAAA